MVFGGQEEALAAEHHGFEATGPLDVVVDGRLKGHDAAGIHAEGFAVQLSLDNGAAGVDERHAVAAQTLQNESLAAKESGADLFLKGDAEFGPQRRAQEGVFLADQLAADLPHVDGNDLTGIGGREGNLGLAAALVGEVGQE